MMMDTIKHFSHKHPLKLRELFVDQVPSPDLLRCSCCTFPIRGPTYCCEQCKYLLHRSCVDFPREITHPFHPLHPLILSIKEIEYSERHRSPHQIFVFLCEQCEFELDVVEAMVTLPDAENQRDIQHFSHVHPLTAFCVERECNLVCKGCNRTITGDAYMCYACRFVLHRECAELPRSVRHPLHADHDLDLIFDPSGRSQCIACRIHFKLFYSCRKCQYYLDVACASSILPPPEEGRSVVKHFFHEHELSCFRLKAETKVHCGLCSKFLSSGEVYGCGRCGFFLHDSCEQRPARIDHPFHPGHLLSLVKLAGPDKRTCVCCSGKGAHKYYFSCQSCDFNLDRACCLESLAYFKGGGSVEIKHSLHEHSLRFGLNIRLRRSCEICGDRIGGPMYFCNTGKCDFWLHKTCAELLPEMDHPFHPQHRLARNPKRVDEYFICGACNMKSKQLAFSCATCGFCLDTSCASLTPDFKHPLHEHKLAHFKEMEGFICDVCNDHCSFDLYRCVQCNFNIHRSCLDLPPTVKHRKHWHSLTLFDKYLEDDTGEYYCEICEERRNPDRGVYCCMKCEFFAHIECTLVERNLKIRDDSALTKIDEEIASLEAAADAKKKEWEEMTRELGELRKRRKVMCS